MNKLLAIIYCIFLMISSVSCTGIEKATGKFEGSFTTSDANGNVETYYHFKSDDNRVWWLLTEEQIGFVPNRGDEYVVIYHNNGTTADSKLCTCDPELNCECEKYDDIFICIEGR